MYSMKLNSSTQNLLTMRKGWWWDRGWGCILIMDMIMKCAGGGGIGAVWYKRIMKLAGAGYIYEEGLVVG